MFLVPLWIFGFVFMLPGVIVGALVALGISARYAENADGSPREPSRRSAAFLATWLVAGAVMAFVECRYSMPGYFMRHATTADAVLAAMPSAYAQGLGAALKYVLPASVALGISAIMVLLIRWRWVQWLVALGSYTGLFIYLGFLDAFLSA